MKSPSPLVANSCAVVLMVFSLIQLFAGHLLLVAILIGMAALGTVVSIEMRKPNNPIYGGLIGGFVYSMAYYWVMPGFMRQYWIIEMPVILALAFATSLVVVHRSVGLPRDGDTQEQTGS